MLIVIISTWCLINSLTKENFDMVSSVYKVESVFLQSKYPTTWNTVVNKSMKNKSVLDGTTSILDDLKESSNYESIIFLNNKSIASSIKESDGNRITNIDLPSKISSKIAADGKSYRGSITINKISYTGIFYPFKDNLNENSAVWFLGTPTLTIVKSAFTNLLPVFIAFLIFIFIITLFLRKISGLLSRHIIDFSSYIKTKMSREGSESFTELKIPPIYIEFFEIVNLMNFVIGNYRAKYIRVSDTLKNITSDMNIVAEEIEKISNRSPDQIVLMKNISSLLEEHSKSINNMFDDVVKEETHAKKRMIRGMSDVFQLFQEISANTKNLNSINTIISNIQDQFNMLSVNAAIESTKAGEYGLGFSVVSEEMRRLAEKNYDYSNQIKNIISSFRENVESFSNNIEKIYDQNSALFESIIKQGASKVEKMSEFGLEFSNINSKNIESARATNDLSKRILNEINELNKL